MSEYYGQWYYEPFLFVEEEMSSGYFPLSTYDEEGKALTLISAQLRDVIEKSREMTRNLECPEDAASDGEYIGRLSLAHQLIVEAIRVEPPPQPCTECKKLVGECVCIPF